MAEVWLTIIGLGEDGPEGLSAASHAALETAEVVMGPPRHLALLPDVTAQRVAWPVPFVDGIPLLEEMRGKNVVVLASGDPFWFGAGTVIARSFDPGEWQAFPGPSTFSLAAARLGWALETTTCLGLHAAPFGRLRPYLAPGQKAIVLVRDGGAVADLATWLDDLGFGETIVHALEALGGPRERLRSQKAAAYDLADVAHPVAVALEVAGTGAVISRVTGKSDDVFEHDGQITKQPVRAITLAALAPRPGEMIWDIGAGSGSVALECLMADPSASAVAIEAREDRAARIRANADALGQDRLQVVAGRAPDALAVLPDPSAIFVGGGLDRALLDYLEARFATQGVRLVANAVTLETEALLIEARSRLGGELTRIEISHAAPLGKFQGWKAAYPVVQWSMVL